jgi:maltooligosyltrehalose synthase
MRGSQPSDILPRPVFGIDPDNRRPVDFAVREQVLPPAAADWRALVRGWREAGSSLR